MTRKRRSAKTRLRIFLTHEGRCHVCNGKIGIGEGWDLDHIIPLALGGDDEEHNLAPAHRKGCHAGKTAAQDVPTIAKAKRREIAHMGAKDPDRQKIRSAGFRKAPKRHPATTVPSKLYEFMEKRR